MAERWEEIRVELAQAAFPACGKDDYVSALHLRTLEGACKRIAEMERERDAARRQLQTIRELVDDYPQGASASSRSEFFSAVSAAMEGAGD